MLVVLASLHGGGREDPFSETIFGIFCHCRQEIPAISISFQDAAPQPEGGYMNFSAKF